MFKYSNMLYTLDYTKAYKQHKLMIDKCRERLIHAMVDHHKVNLSHKFAFALHRKTIGEVKNCIYPRPPKLCLAGVKYANDDISTVCVSEQSAGCADKGEHAEIINEAIASNNATLKKVIAVLNLYEDYLLTAKLVDDEKIKLVRHFNRSMLARVLNCRSEFSSIPRDSVGLTIALLSAEKIGLNKLLFLKFIGEMLQNKRITKISQLRKGRTYGLLTAIAAN